MKDIIDDINKYVDAPSVDRFSNTTDKVIEMLNQLDEMIMHFEDDNKRNVMKKNITMAQSFLIDNMEIINDYLKEK